MLYSLGKNLTNLSTIQKPCYYSLIHRVSRNGRRVYFEGNREPKAKPCTTTPNNLPTTSVRGNDACPATAAVPGAPQLVHLLTPSLATSVFLDTLGHTASFSLNPPSSVLETAAPRADTVGHNRTRSFLIFVFIRVYRRASAVSNSDIFRTRSDTIPPTYEAEPGPPSRACLLRGSEGSAGELLVAQQRWAARSY